MAKSLEFGKSVLVMDADDTKLEAALKADEQLVTQSVNKMQGNLDKLEVSMQGTGDAAGVATTGVSALGAAASASGSTSLMVASQLGTLGISLRNVGDQAVGASSQLLIMGKAAAAFIATPIGATIAITAAALGALAWAASKAAAAVHELTEKEQLLADIQQARSKQTQSYEKSMEALSDKILVATDRMSKSLARWRELGRTRPELSLLQTLKLGEKEEYLARILERQAATRAKQLAVSAEADRMEKDRLATEKERLRVAETLATAAEAEARALTARAGPQTPEEARGMVREQIELENARQRGIYNLLKLQERTGPGGERYAVIEKLLSRFGFGGPVAGATPTATRFGQGAIELSAFAGTGRRGAGAVGPDPIQSARIAKEDKRTKAAEATARNTERLAEAFGRWRTGAG